MAVIGGGVIGVAAAFELAAEKLRVVVLDRQQPGREASWAAAGMLSPAPDSPRDIPLVPLCLESLKLYPDFVAAIEEASGHSAGYARAGTLELFSGFSTDAQRDSRLADCRRLGISAEDVSIDIARSSEPKIGPSIRHALWFPDEGTVEPRLLMEALIAAARHRNVDFRADREVTGLLFDADRCTGVIAAGEHIPAKHVVLAAGCFSSHIGSKDEILSRYTPTRPVRGQMIALHPDGPCPARVLRSDRGYLVPRRDGRIVVGSTTEEAGFEKRVTPAGIRRILFNALELYPALGNAEVLEVWSGLRPGTPDDLPILGFTEIYGLLIATGHYRNGILLSAVTAKLIREWVTTGRANFDTRAFSPLRFTEKYQRAALAK